MDDRVLPLIFLNLCGEMLYVILQRLDAQNISPEKTTKVIQDILSTMLNDQFIEELFKPQKMYTRLAMQSVFEKLVHSSIMRLNSNSMSKLYDLMLMVFKYQVANCKKSEDVLLLTLNHLDAIRNCAKPYSDLSSKVKNVYALVIANYGYLNYNDYECLYRCIDAFLEDLNIRVSVLMKLGLQLPSGEIVILKNADNVSNVVESEGECQFDIKSRRFDFEGERNFTLGTNINQYDSTMLSAFLTIVDLQIEIKLYTLSTAEQSKVTPEHKKLPPLNAESPNEKELRGIEEISLLTRLIGKSMPSNIVPEILLASPNDENFDSHEIENEENCAVVNIDASHNSKQDLEKICNDLIINVEEKQKFDILDLLDTVETNNVS